MKENRTKQRKPSFGKGGVPTPAGFEAHPERRNNGGVPKRFLEIRKEIANLLDPNLNEADYKKIVDNRKTESYIRAIFAEAVLKRDIKTIFEMINQAMGKPKETIDHTILEPPKPLDDLRKKEEK